MMTGLAVAVLPLFSDAGRAQQPSAPEPKFEIDEFRVEGNTVLSTADIENAVYDFLGPDKTVADIEKARAALTALYVRKGYPTVSADVPRQRMVDGVVVLQVIERKVGRLRVTGAHYFEPAVIKDAAPSLAEGTVPNINAVQRDILALNQQADRTVTPVLRAGRAPNTVDVDLQVSDQPPVHGSLELNNRSSVDTKPLRLVGSLSYDNLWQRGDSATAFFEVAPQRPSDATVWSGSYLFHIPGTDLSLLGSYLKSDSNVSTVGSTNVVGKGQIAGLRLLVPLLFEPSSIQTLSVGMDYKNFTQDLTLSGAGSHVPIEYYPITATYQGSWPGDTSQTDFTASVVLGTPSLGSDEVVFDENRYDAKPNFIYLRGALSHTHDLPYGMQVWVRAQGQLAPSPLVPNEQLSVGGADTVRGYQESEFLADNGGILQMELRSPSLANMIGPPVNELRFHAFADVSAADIDNPLPEQRSYYSLDSMGAGVRLRILNHFNAELQDAVALSTGPSTKSGTNRVLFRLLGSF